MRLQLRTALLAGAAAALLGGPAFAWEAGKGVPTASPAEATKNGGGDSAQNGGAANAGNSGDSLKPEIDGFLGRLVTSTDGLVSWDGSDPYEVRQEGEDAVVVITNARLSIHADQVAQLAFDRIEIRRGPDKTDPSLARITVSFPSQSILTGADGKQLKLNLKEASAQAVIESQSGRAHETTMTVASARLEDPADGSWISFGPLNLSSSLTSAADGAWKAPVEVELKQVEFFFPQGPVGGTLDRIAYSVNTAGPNLADLDQLRDRLDKLRQQADATPEARVGHFLETLPEMPTAFSEMRGRVELDKLAVRVATGEPLMSLGKASIGGELTGLSGDKAAFRITIDHEALDLAPSMFEPAKVPHRMLMDFGLDNIATEALRSLLQAASHLRPGASDEEKQQATQQMIGASAMLSPTFHMYDFAVETNDVGVDLTGEVKGSPLAPTGYQAGADATVRGFEALPTLLEGAPYSHYLPLLQELAAPAQAQDGTPRLRFHLASAPPKWITINGNDVSLWFVDGPHGQARLLKPAEPPMRGDDVAQVQRALDKAGLPVDQNAVYDPATAVAVARFQKRNNLNESGVVDADTRRALGVTGTVPPTPPPGTRF